MNGFYENYTELKYLANNYLYFQSKLKVWAERQRR